MNITQFDRMRINSESSIVGAVFMDVRAFDAGCSSGFMAVAYEIPSSYKEFAEHKVEVRTKERQVALITYKYSDAEIPEWWRDAEVLYSWTQPKKGENQ